MFLMMFSLITYILYGFVEYRLTNRKSCITTLPGKTFIYIRQVLYPSAAVTLYFFYKMRYTLA